MLKCLFLMYSGFESFYRPTSIFHDGAVTTEDGDLGTQLEDVGNILSRSASRHAEMCNRLYNTLKAHRRPVIISTGTLYLVST